MNPLFLADLTVTITQQDHPPETTPMTSSSFFSSPHTSTNITTSASSASSSMRATGDRSLDTGFTFYTAHVRFSGSRVGRSKGLGRSAATGESTSLFQGDHYYDHHGQYADSRPEQRRSRRQLSTKTLPRQGLLVVTVQFSDGSVLPWHRIVEVSAPSRHSNATRQATKPNYVSALQPTHNKNNCKAA